VFYVYILVIILVIIFVIFYFLLNSRLEMTLVVGCLGQKGGTGKSTLAKLLATEYSRDGVTTLLADMDCTQLNSTRWAKARNEAAIEPPVWAMPICTPREALLSSSELVIFDGKGHAAEEALEIAKLSNLVILPTGISYDDLFPQVELAQILVRNKIPSNRIVMVLMSVGSVAEERDAREFIHIGGFTVLPTALAKKATYRGAANQCRALSETIYPALNEQAVQVVYEVGLVLKEKLGDRG
jgi:chromosome partitioning protein